MRLENREQGNVSIPELFESWRLQARSLFTHGVDPHEAQFRGLVPECSLSPAGSLGSGSLGSGSLGSPGGEETQPVLFRGSRVLPVLPIGTCVTPKRFLRLAKTVACHRDSQKWHKLYALLWRLNKGEKALLNIPSDPLVLSLLRWEKAVERDRHKMTAFVRFRERENGALMAFYRPEHFVVELTAPFFVKRFGCCEWTIFTPHRSVHWDGSELRYGRGQGRDPFTECDEFEELWCDYYRSIFNPSRIKIQAMKREMPRKYWSTLPEAKVIPSLIQQTQPRLHQMHKQSTVAAVVPEVSSLRDLNSALLRCRACDLAFCDSRERAATPGEGRAGAEFMIIGEQPFQEQATQEQAFQEQAFQEQATQERGTQERTGVGSALSTQFPGTAGILLREILQLAGISEAQLYLTFAVKHPCRPVSYSSVRESSASPRQKKIARPTGFQLNCCKPWLLKEIELVNPKHILLLGSSSAQALLGRKVVVQDEYLKVYVVGGRRISISHPPSTIVQQRTVAQRKKLTEKLYQSFLLLKEGGMSKSAENSEEYQ
ncbi:TIGR03915 family putative DNA repair protein [bacterium]|nr:TIGR03915 family putative DNA repair protein [bacterium]